jgi:hypothetical protein
MGDEARRCYRLREIEHESDSDLKPAAELRPLFLGTIQRPISGEATANLATNLGNFG